MKSIIAASILALALAAPAHAGDKERGIIYGVLGTVLLSELAQANRHRNDYYYRNNRYYRDPYRGGFPPFRCSGDEVRCAYERGVWERELQAWQEAKNRAYWCGRDPRRCNP